jgi:hypothetical protein
MRISAKRVAVTWAEREFGHAGLGDGRRTARLVAVAACACERPHGRVSAVFATEKEREGAYDILENEHYEHTALVESVAEATALRCEGERFVYVPTDGTSLTLADHAAEKDFGSVGTNAQGARGLKVIDALAVDSRGVVIGWLALTFWARSTEPGARPAKGTYARAARDVEDKETWHWMQTIRAAGSKLRAHGVRGWFQIDREGDSRDLLLELTESDHWWTVRSRTNRRIGLEGDEVGHLREQLARLSMRGHYELEVSGKHKRRARKARMAVRFERVILRLRDPRTDRITLLPVTAVWTREEGTTPSDEEPIDWMLLTNREVTNLEQAREVIAGYATRWRVEECHKTWKSDGCNVEQSQLRTANAVMKWATILASVAARIERLKRLARTQPEAPATVELRPIEVRALVLLKRRYRNAKEVIRDNPSIHQAVLWIAQLGGYTGKSSGGPPGALTIRRGLDRLAQAVEMMLALAEQGHGDAK